MVGGNHQVPGIANESELKAFIPGRPEDFTLRRRFGMDIWVSRPAMNAARAGRLRRGEYCFRHTWEYG